MVIRAAIHMVRGWIRVAKGAHVVIAVRTGVAIWAPIEVGGIETGLEPYP